MKLETCRLTRRGEKVSCLSETWAGLYMGEDIGGKLWGENPNSRYINRTWALLAVRATATSDNTIISDLLRPTNFLPSSLSLYQLVFPSRSTLIQPGFPTLIIVISIWKKKKWTTVIGSGLEIKRIRKIGDVARVIKPKGFVKSFVRSGLFLRERNVRDSFFFFFLVRARCNGNLQL